MDDLQKEEERKHNSSILAEWRDCSCQIVGGGGTKRLITDCSNNTPCQLSPFCFELLIHDME